MFSQRKISFGKKGFGVKPSPFNKVKLKLGLILILLPTLWIIVHNVVNHPLGQLALLGGYSLITSIWLGLEIRTILAKSQKGATSAPAP